MYGRHSIVKAEGMIAMPRKGNSVVLSTGR